MRFKVLFLAIVIASSLFSQLDFIGNYSTEAHLIYLSDNEPVIMIYDQFDEYIELYNTDLTLMTSFDIPIEYVGNGQYNLYHVSRNLFDCDTTNIEYLISYSAFDVSEAYVKIIREDESILFDLPEHIFDNYSTLPRNKSSMIEDENGVVFSFFNSGLPGGPSSLYRSCGSIPDCCSPCNSDSVSVGINDLIPDLVDFKLYPNPSNNRFALEYDLPKSYSSAFLSLMDMNGKEVLRKRVGPSMSYILVDTTPLSLGRYQVLLRTENEILISTSYLEVE